MSVVNELTDAKVQTDAIIIYIRNAIGLFLLPEFNNLNRLAIRPTSNTTVINTATDIPRMIR